MSSSTEAAAPSDLSSIDEPQTQPTLARFPTTLIMGKLRSFSTTWYNEFNWLEYSKSRDAIFCKYCRHFPGIRNELAFVSVGFKRWNHTRAACVKHDTSKPHMQAHEKMMSYRESLAPNGRGTVLNQMHGDAYNVAFIEKNRKHVKVVIDIVMLCAKNDIPLRGHRETAESLNKGNFLELFKFITKYDPEVQKRLDEMKSNATMMSPEIQNELLECAASLLLRNIKKEVHESSHFAILGDEYKDQSKRELVAVCLRYIHGGVIKERAIGFAETGDMTADGISKKILQVLEPLELDPSRCVGFCFDGASVMSGNKGGVHVLLKKTFKSAVYVHCNSHRLNLVLCTAAKVSGNISSFFDTVNALYSFMTGVRRHARFIELQKEMHPTRRVKELERATDTRWSSRSGAISKTLELLDVLLEHLAECLDESDRRTSQEADSLLQQIQTKKFIFLLVAFGKLFDTSDFATKGLQDPKSCVSECIALIESVKNRFKTFRDNTNGDFDKVIKLTDEIMQKNDITEWDVKKSRERKMPARLSDSVVTTSLGKATTVKSNADLRQIWISLLERQLTELNCRFQDDSYGLMRAASSLQPGSNTFG